MLLGNNRPQHFWPTPTGQAQPEALAGHGLDSGDRTPQKKQASPEHVFHLVY